MHLSAPIELRIRTAQWSCIAREAVERYPLETGGILLGSWISEGVVSVTDVVGSGPAARHGERSFDPDHEWQVRQVARRWERRPELIEYLGDWHTHPDGRNRPSWRDRAVARTIAATPEARAPRPAMLIVTVCSSGLLRPSAHILTGRRLRRATFLLDAE